MPDAIDFKETIEKLVLLQELDSEIYDLESEKETFPEKIGEMDASLDTKKTGMQEADEELKAAQLSKSEKEGELQTQEERIKKHDGELYKIKNNKEYTALQNEIDSIKADVSILEEEILVLMDKIEEAKVKCDQEKKIFEKESQKVQQEKERIKIEEAKIVESLIQKKAKRAEEAGVIAPDVLRRYENILKSRGKVALARITGECCGECNLQLRPQIINEAKLKQAITSCESCSRILYAEE